VAEAHPPTKLQSRTSAFNQARRCEERKRRSNLDCIRGEILDCSHGDGVCQGGWSALCSIAGQLFVPTVEVWRWRAQIRSRPVRRTAAKRLGLEVIEHVIRLRWSGVSGMDTPWSAILGSSRFWQSGFTCQIKLTFGRRAMRTAPTFRLRRAGPRGRSHSSLRLCEAMQSIGSSTRIGRG